VGPNAALVASVAVGAFGVLIAAATLVFYRFQQKGEDSDDARTEALALAETRGKRVDDLEQQVARLEKARREDRDLHDKQIRSLRAELTALEQRIANATRDFAVAQSLTARAAIDLVITVTDQLERKPPQVKEALTLLHAYTTGQTGASV
jgi:hypothetical protein